MWNNRFDASRQTSGKKNLAEVDRSLWILKCLNLRYIKMCSHMTKTKLAARVSSFPIGGWCGGMRRELGSHFPIQGRYQPGSPLWDDGGLWYFVKRNETKQYFLKWYFAKGYFAKWYFAKRYFAKWYFAKHRP